MNHGLEYFERWNKSKRLCYISNKPLSKDFLKARPLTPSGIFAMIYVMCEEAQRLRLNVAPFSGKGK